MGDAIQEQANNTTMCVCYACVFQTEYARFEGGRYVFRIHRSPLCEYMINFIHKLKHLPEKYMMNSVLENFTILLVNRQLLSPQPQPPFPRSVYCCVGTKH